MIASLRVQTRPIHRKLVSRGSDQGIPTPDYSDKEASLESESEKSDKTLGLYCFDRGCQWGKLVTSSHKRRKLKLKHTKYSDFEFRTIMLTCPCNEDPSTPTISV